MIFLGIESSCDETGVALFDTKHGLLAQTLHSQISMHEAYGGVVPELASRDHIRRVLPLLQQALDQAGITKHEIDAIGFTQGPGLAGALLVGGAIACSLGLALDKPVIGIHHLEGHLLSPLLSKNPPNFPFIALLVSGGHTQIMKINGVGQYHLLGETVDDAAGEAFDKSAKLLNLPYPGGPAISKLAETGNPAAFKFPRPMLHSGDLNFSFSGLKTALLTAVRSLPQPLNEVQKADLARGFVDAIVDILCIKSCTAMKETGYKQMVVAGGVGANTQLRAALNATAQKKHFQVFYPELEFCTDNGAMIALAAALRLQCNPSLTQQNHAFNVNPRWPLSEVNFSHGLNE